MRARKTKKANIIIPILLVLTILAGGAVYYHFNNEIEVYQRSSAQAAAFFETSTLNIFTNSAVNTRQYITKDPHSDALYIYEAPEGFTIISHSQQWDPGMLEQLRRELKLNAHGDEMEFLYEIVVYPHAEDEEGRAAASYTFGTKSVEIFIPFPALPPDFTINIPQDFGSINLYNGDKNTTIESMAGSLSHEYGHLYTYYYMFNFDGDDDEMSKQIASSEYARLREAERNDLLTSVSRDELYWQQRHRYLIEIAAEDYVQLMGSPTTRQIIDFVDVRQVVNGAEHPEREGDARNAFPQENLMIPLASEVNGLSEYFFSFLGIEPGAPIEEKKEITLEIDKNSIQHNLVSGLRTFVHYTISWNAPYQSAVYTLVCYDPVDYTGWGIPVKTVRPGQTTSAVIGEYALERGTQVVSMDDGNATGKKVFFVVALLPDGTFYLSEKLEYQF